MAVTYRIVLLPSPYLGQHTWLDTAEQLRATGAEVVLADAGSSFDPRTIAEDFRRSCADLGDAVLVAHSNAALYLPRLLVEAPNAIGILVDAAIPPEDQEVSMAPAAGRRQLSSLERDGWLPSWPLWWDEDVWRSMIRSQDRRDALLSQAPPVPAGYLAAQLDLPSGWHRGPRGYLCFQEAYRDELNAAHQLGWATRMLPGTHLHMVDEPQETAAAIIHLIDAIRG